MDPLSLSASLLGLLGLATQCSKALKQLRPGRDVTGLMNEIDDIRIVARCCQEIFLESSMRAMSDDLRKLAHITDQIVLLLRQVEAAVGKFETPRPRIRHLARASYRQNLLAITGQLRERRQLLSMYLSSLNSSVLADANMKATRLMARTENNALNPQINALIQEQQNRLSKLGLLYNSDHVPGQNADELPSSHTGSFAVASVVSRSISTCICECHQPHVVFTPQLVSPYIGSLRIIYMRETHCRHQACTNAIDFDGLHTAFLRGTYRFPSWFSACAIYIEMRETSTGRLLSLRVPRIVPSDSVAFIYCREGDISGLRSLLVSGLTSCDYIDTIGNTLLHVGFNFAKQRIFLADDTQAAVKANQREIARFLLQEGASPYSYNDKQM